MRRSAALSAPPAGPATSTRRPLRADARRNYERLVGAARSVLAERGSEASMEEIAKRADVGVGTLYRHFPRRIDLVEAVYREDVESLVTLADSVVVGATPWNALVEWLDGFVRYAQAKRVFLTELHEAFEKNPELRVASRERINVALDSVLTRAQRAGFARTDIDGSDLMQLVTSLCTSATLSEGQGERLLAVILDGLRPPG